MSALYKDNKDVPEDMLLGNLLFYNLTDMTISESDLTDEFNNNNLSPDYVRKISHADAFRRATSSIKNEKVIFVDDNNNNFEGRINVDEVVNDQMYIKRIVGVRVLNDKKEEVSYVQLGSISYDRAMDSFLSYIENDADKHVSNVVSLFKDVENRYNNWSVFHNHDTVKNIIKRIVDDMHPTALMPTGLVKFIPKTYKDKLYGLEGLLNSLSDYSNNAGEKNTIEIYPFLDTEQSRNRINEMYEEEIKESLYDYSMELADILKKKQTLSVRQATTYTERYKELASKVHDYESLLGTYTQNIKDQLKQAFQFIDDNKET